jgi:hypothetical protein
MTLQLGSMGIYDSRRARTCAARAAEWALSAVRSHGARSHPRPSGAPATLWPALEGLFASPCSPTDSFLCAGRRSRSYATASARQLPASAPETAPAAPRRARLARVGAHGVPRRGRRFMDRERVVGGGWRRSRRLSTSTARGTYASVRRVANGRRVARRGLAARARS